MLPALEKLQLNSAYFYGPVVDGCVDALVFLYSPLKYASYA